MFGLNWIKNKTVYQNLLELKGISYTTAKKLCAFLGISTKTLFSDLSYHKLEQINLVLSVYSKKANPLPINKLSDLDPMFKPKCSVPGILKKTPLRAQTTNPKGCLHTPILNALNSWTKEHVATLVAINSYRGRRLKLGYPSKGQRTKSNASTASKLNKGRI